MIGVIVATTASNGSGDNKQQAYPKKSSDSLLLHLNQLRLLSQLSRFVRALAV